jgi:hypothetical protein
LENYQSYYGSSSNQSKKQIANVYKYATRILKGENPNTISIPSGWGQELLDRFYKENRKSNTITTTQTDSPVLAGSKGGTRRLSDNYFYGHNPRMTMGERTNVLLNNIIADLDGANNSGRIGYRRNADGTLQYFSNGDLNRLTGYFEALRGQNED